VTPSSGGVDKESLDDAKKRGPRDAATHDSLITDSDYAQYIASFNHPSFGAVSKAVATVRTGLNANRVELYILAEGSDGPIAPNEGLKRSVQSAVDEINTLTDEAVVLDAQIKSVDIDANVIVSRSSDASVVKSRVNSAIEEFFKTKNWDLGEPLYLSNLYDAINQVDGVKYVDIFAPTDNILATNEIDSSSASGVDVNELITLGNQEIRYYYEAT
jgi:phage-related baseplate assembly protein